MLLNVAAQFEQTATQFQFALLHTVFSAGEDISDSLWNPKGQHRVHRSPPMESFLG
jgi:hypothetical protein